MSRIIQFGLLQAYDEDRTYLAFQNVHQDEASIYDAEGIIDGREFRRAIANVFGGNMIDFFYEDTDHISYEDFEANAEAGLLYGSGLYGQVENLVLKNVAGKYFYNIDNGREGTELAEMFGENIDVEMDKGDFEIIVAAKKFFENSFSKKIEVES